MNVCIFHKEVVIGIFIVVDATITAAAAAAAVAAAVTAGIVNFG